LRGPLHHQQLCIPWTNFLDLVIQWNQKLLRQISKKNVYCIVFWKDCLLGS
jgi:hypothetical protein